MPLAPEPDVETIEALIKKVMPVIAPILAGHHPDIQGGVLADLVATWLAGHGVADSVPRTRALRAALFANFLLLVERLVPICAEELGTPHDPIEPDPGPGPFRWH